MSVARNTAYNVVGALLPVGVSLVTVPAYLERIGHARYGVLAVAWVLLGYFGVFDLGLGRATTQRIAALSNAPRDARANAFWTGLLMNAALGSLGALLVWPTSYLVFDHTLDAADPLRDELLAALPWLSLALPIATGTGVMAGALQGRQRFLVLNAVSVVGTVLFQCLPLAVAMLWSPRLDLVLPAAIGARAVSVLALYLLCRHDLLQGSPRFDRREARELIRFGGWVTVTSFVGPLMVTLDRILIGALNGASAVSHYVVPFQLAERLTILPAALSSAIFPRLALATDAERDTESRAAHRTLVFLMTPAALGGVLVMPTFLAVWIDPAFSERSGLAGQILLVGWWANSLAKVPYAQLQARGRPDLVAFCHLAEFVPNLALLWLGLTYAGIEGAALAFTARAVADFGLLAGFAGLLSRDVVIAGALGLAVLVAGTLAAPLLAYSPAGLALALCGVGAVLGYCIKAIRSESRSATSAP